MVPFIIAVSAALQVPLILAAGALVGHPGLVAGFALVLTGGFVFSLMGPRGIWGDPGRASLYLVLWPFFVWWTLAIFAALLTPVALLAWAVLPVSTPAVLASGLGLAAVGAAAGLAQRPRVRQHVVQIEGLPVAFDGYRVAHISDLHCGPFASGTRVAGWVATVNGLGADLVAVTGDLIASGAAFVPVVAGALGKLRAPDGVFACMGNHDYFTDGEALVRALEGAGLTVLRNRGVNVRRKEGALHVAGVDDTWTRKADVRQALAGRPVATPVVLLAHDPDLFPEAAERGVDLTLSGHTHGGQLGLPLFARRVNLARVTTRFTSGYYRLGMSTLYVNRGLGTTGPPVRVGVPAEIVVFTLRVAEAGAGRRARRAGRG
jgi:predicted MPP superfamily phosphohydrolase